MKYIKYFLYVLKHKWFVLYAGVRGFRVPLWRLIKHDLSKFRPDEFIPYARYFMGKRTAFTKAKFEDAVDMHYRRNRHHPEHWRDDTCEAKGTYIEKGMRELDIREMLADWAGAGRAITGKWELFEWWEANKAQKRFVLSKRVFDRAEELISGLREELSR